MESGENQQAVRKTERAAPTSFSACLARAAASFRAADGSEMSGSAEDDDEATAGAEGAAGAATGLRK